MTRLPVAAPDALLERLGGCPSLTREYDTREHLDIRETRRIIDSDVHRFTAAVAVQMAWVMRCTFNNRLAGVVLALR